MKIFVFGNPIVKQDSLPIKYLPRLKESFPDIEFILADPTESWTRNEQSIIIIDTVIGLDNAALFESLDSFEKQGKQITPHDYDLYTDLKLLKKLGKIKQVMIIGIPANGRLEDLKKAIARVKKGIEKSKAGMTK